MKRSFWILSTLLLLIGCQPQTDSGLSGSLSSVSRPEPAVNTAKIHNSNDQAVWPTPTLILTAIPEPSPTEPDEPAPTAVPSLSIPQRAVYSLDIQTQIPEIDRILQAIRAKDTAPLRELVQFTTVACTNETGMGGPPKCWAGPYQSSPLEDGTPVEVIPILGPEGMWVFPETLVPTLEELTTLTGIYAIYSLNADHSEGQYGILFLQEGDLPVEVRVDEGIVAIYYHYFRQDGSPENIVAQYAQEFVLPPPQGGEGGY
ncbi:MAG: hypothetical protein QNJ45_14700 [Ardenticatenaceae bacterium]|nr:hypothetical protein [Ardenticatenaceae bacterium]